MYFTVGGVSGIFGSNHKRTIDMMDDELKTEMRKKRNFFKEQSFTCQNLNLLVEPTNTPSLLKLYYLKLLNLDVRSVQTEILLEGKRVTCSLYTF